MKNLVLSTVSLLLLCTCLTSCEVAVQSPDQSVFRETPNSRSSTPASPVIAYQGIKSVSSHGTTSNYNTIAVMDSDGSNPTDLLVATATSTHFDEQQWTPDNSKIFFHEHAGSVNALKTIDVSVVNGVPQGSSLTTIYTLDTHDTMPLIQCPEYCSSSSTAKIAYGLIGYGESWLRIYTISTSGGTPTLLYQQVPTGTHDFVQTIGGGITWSPDDSRLAFVTHQGLKGQGWSTVNDSLFIMNPSNGSITDSVAITATHGIANIVWSRSGQNVITWREFDGSGGYTVSYYNVTTKTLTSGQIGPFLPETWSQNNSSILAKNGSYFAKLQPMSSSYSTTTISATNRNFLNWKR